MVRISRKRISRERISRQRISRQQGVAGLPEIRFYLHKEFRDRQIRFYLHKQLMGAMLMKIKKKFFFSFFLFLKQTAARGARADVPRAPQVARQKCRKEKD